MYSILNYAIEKKYTKQLKLIDLNCIHMFLILVANFYSSWNIPCYINPKIWERSINDFIIYLY